MAEPRHREPKWLAKACLMLSMVLPLVEASPGGAKYHCTRQHKVGRQHDGQQQLWVDIAMALRHAQAAACWQAKQVPARSLCDDLHLCWVYNHAQAGCRSYLKQPTAASLQCFCNTGSHLCNRA